MAYYSHNHNLAYDFTLFEEPYEGQTVARVRKKKSEGAAASEAAASENQENTLTPGKKRAKSSRRRKNIGRIALGVVIGVAVMAMIASIIHGQVQLTELNQEIIDARAELAEKQSIYTQLEMKVDSSVSTTVVEQYAKEQLSMNKANNSQKEFVSLSDGDKAEVTMSEDKNIFERIGDAFSSLWS
jgi:cell division protein FtsL